MENRGENVRGSRDTRPVDVLGYSTSRIRDLDGEPRQAMESDGLDESHPRGSPGGQPSPRRASRRAIRVRALSSPRRAPMTPAAGNDSWDHVRDAERSTRWSGTRLWDVPASPTDRRS